MADPAIAKPARGSRKAFQRTDIPVSERVASAVCLALLAAIAAAIWWQGGHYDPARYAVRVEALRSTAAAVEGKAGTVRATDARPEEAVRTSAKPASNEEEGAAMAGGEAGTSPSPAVKGEALEIKLAGLKPMSNTEFYGPDNLFEKIDGRAPAYVSFHFQQLRSRSFAVTGTAGSYVDVYEFRFDTPVNAFGMFALERDLKGKPLDFAPDGYSGDMGWFFRQGAVYVQILASDQNPKTLALALAIAQHRAQNLPADNTGLDARRRLPASGLDPASVQFVQDNALGMETFKDVYQATYDFGGKKLSFFVMAATPAKAAAAWKAYLEFSGKYGGVTTALPDLDGAKIFQGESSGSFRVVYLRDGEVGGVVDAEDRDKARQFVEQYLKGTLR